jgi:hypothetical protein
MIRILVAIAFSVLLAVSCPARTQGREPQGLTCAQQLTLLSRQYASECAGRFGRPPVCERCPADSANCAAKCSECKIIDSQLKKKEDECGT